MSKAWKGWADGCRWVDDVHDPGNTPVLVIDASDFPDDYPMIDSEWTAHDGRQLVVVGAPVFGTSSREWLVPTRSTPDGITHLTIISTLKPIPKTATFGDVVGQLDVEVGEDMDHYVFTNICHGKLRPGRHAIVRLDP